MLARHTDSRRAAAAASSHGADSDVVRMAQRARQSGDMDTAYCLYGKAMRLAKPSGAAALMQEMLGCLTELCSGAGRRQQRRMAASWARDAQRDPASVRIFCMSDLHVDQGDNMARLRTISATSFQHDVLIVAGDVADTAAGVMAALKLLRTLFGRVFYIPGNHDLWIHPGSEVDLYPDSFCKLLALLQICDHLQVETAPAEVARGVFVVPLLSWYNHMFDSADPTPGRYRFDKFCKWPVSEADVWQVMLNLNKPAISQVQQRRGTDSHVISFSHFLPSRLLPFSLWVPDLAKAVGCEQLAMQLQQVGSTVHVYGHTHQPFDATLPVEGGPAGQSTARFVHHPLADNPGPVLRCVWDARLNGRVEGAA